ncbi:uncharacterized protein LOC126470778 [Schistocerca serialis cubense]|uniref:uncharacterized protein LOC126470778 n=1 Tax=Schistocerca serialis cubense TaxID=2023355 RepID=UPI00214E05BA|nr:uncharacterized protein LOC126470778 [Schistocerca serialis cubense]
MTRSTLGLPVVELLPGHYMKIPYFFAGDSVFSLSENLMKPYSGDFAKGIPHRIFNYRSRTARQTVENAFGISSSVFQVLRKPILLSLEKAEVIVMAVILLHSCLRTNSPNLYTPAGIDHKENGASIEGSCSVQGEDNMTSLLPLRHVP